MVKKNSPLCLLLCIILCLTTLNVSFSQNANAKKIQGNTAIALNVAEEGIVLLKNDDECLPFNSEMNIGMYGEGQDSKYVSGGLGSGWVDTDSISTPYKGLKTAASQKLIKSATKMKSPNESGYDRVIYFLYRVSTEGEDRKAEDGDYYLSDQEKNDISALVKAYPGKVTVVLNVAGVIDTTWLIENNVSSIVLLWMAGSTGGTALAKVLSGSVSPSGKVADTWASSFDDYLSSANFSHHSYVYYYEDIFVGYRQFETFDPNYEKVNYEFGYGLSYTDFDIKVNEIKADAENISASVTVTNTGTEYSGKEVVQFYYSAPNGTFGNPSKELGDFAKTRNLAPGESQQLTLKFKTNDMASYDDTGKISKSSWVLEKGEYNFYVGNSIKNAGSRGIVGKYTVSENIIVEECFTYGSVIDKRLTSNGTFETFDSSPYKSFDAKTHDVEKYGFTYITATECVDVCDNAQIESAFFGTQTRKTFGYLDAPNSFITYSLNVENEGEYNIALSLASGKGDISDVCDIEINGKAQNLSFSTKGEGWDQFNLSNSQSITLPKGKVELKIVGKSMVNLAYLLIYNNKVAPNSKTIIEAEIAKEAENITFFRSEAVTNMSTAGTSLSYKVFAEKSGDYYLSLNYSNSAKAVENAIEISTNGNKLSNGLNLMRTGYSKAFTDNNSLYKFAESEPVKIHLNEGENTIVLNATSKASSIGYIDSLVISPNDSGIVYTDNTDEFSNLNSNGTKLSEELTFEDLYMSFADADKDNDLLDEFISQLSIYDMANMAGLYHEQDNSDTGTGGYGSTGGKNPAGKFGLHGASTADGPAGIRSVVGEAFTYMPCVSMLTSTWNKELAYKFGEAVGKEGADAGVEVWLAPGANIHRNPLCGRNFEYISEDPYITGIIASQIINGCQSQGVGCSLKHFAANNKENNRTNSYSILSERALREIYLKGFEIAIKESDPVTVMTSYNYINDSEVAYDRELLIEIARNEWEYDGLFISDWGNNISHPISLINGNNIMSSNPEADAIVSAFYNGELSRDILEENTKYVLKSMLKLTNGCIKNIPVPSNGATINANAFSASTAEVNVTDGFSSVNNAHDLYYTIIIEKDNEYSLSFNLDSQGEFGFDVYINGNKYCSAYNKDGGKGVYSFGKDSSIKLEAGINKVLISVTIGEFVLKEFSVLPSNDINNTLKLENAEFKFEKSSVYASTIKEDSDCDTSDDEVSNVSEENISTEAEQSSDNTNTENNGRIIVFVVVGIIIVALIITFILVKKKKNK